MPRRLTVITGCLATLLLVAFVPLQLDANHSWSGFHWNGDVLPVDVIVGDNTTTPEWHSRFDQALLDWNTPISGAASIHLIEGIGLSDPATCSPNIGRIEVCNWTYGDNGWLGLAQVWVYRGKDKHIAQATTLLNDTYFSQAGYNTWAWRQLVMCQEIAHDFGLDHQDEAFDNYNLGTCMDYTSAPEGGWFDGFDYGPSNTAPNQHDFDQIAETYAHISGGGGGGGGKPGGGGGGGGGRRGGAAQAGGFPELPDQALPRVGIDSPAQWGRLIRDNGRSALYELELGNNVVVFTFVTWAS